MKDNKFIIVYVTHKNIEEAKKMSSVLLDKKIIACINYLPINSEYFWEGSITNENEIVTLFKTIKENWEILCNEIKNIHSYEIPAIIKFEVEANEECVNWIKENCVPGAEN